MSKDVLEMLNTLPGGFDYVGNVSERFVSERKIIETPDQLRSFVEKWKLLWEIPMPSYERSEHEENLVSLSFDAEQTLQCLADLSSTSKTGECLHLEKGENCVGMYIMVPPVLLSASLTSRQYEVPFNVALLQLFRAGIAEE